jgi:1,4-dihydroxy-2-naphthoate octaprenyltransferase
MNTLKLILGPTRMPFLILTPACVAVGVGTAFQQTGRINWLHLILVLIGALASHVCVNTFNEYFDYHSGLDAKTRRTPFSGGSGTLPGHPELAPHTLFVAIGSLIVTAIVGVYFLWLHGWLLLPIGVAGLVLVVTYTIWWTYHPVLCLLAPGLGFGTLMVLGTHFAMTGTYNWTAAIASCVPAFLVSDLLLLNQFPDVEADRSIGRRHFPITIGRRASATLYGLLLLTAYATVLAAVIFDLLPPFSLLALLTAIPAWKAYRGAYRYAENIAALIPAMGLNVKINLATPVLLAVGLFIG